MDLIESMSSLNLGLHGSQGDKGPKQNPNSSKKGKSKP
jgi:hypothetical protein